MRGKGNQWTSATRSYHQLHLPTFRPASWFHYFNSKAPCILGYRAFHILVRLVFAYSITFIDYNISMVIHSNFRFEFILLVTKNEDRLKKEAAWTGSGVGGSVRLSSHCCRLRQCQLTRSVIVDLWLLWLRRICVSIFLSLLRLPLHSLKLSNVEKK